MTIDNLYEETDNDSARRYCHDYDDGRVRRTLKLENNGLGDFRFRYNDDSGEHCDTHIPLGVVLCLLSRAGYGIRQPASMVGGK